jgi:hypothetical protein
MYSLWPCPYGLQASEIDLDSFTEAMSTLRRFLSSSRACRSMQSVKRRSRLASTGMSQLLHDPAAAPLPGSYSELLSAGRFRHPMSYDAQ